MTFEELVAALIEHGYDVWFGKHGAHLTGYFAWVDDPENLKDRDNDRWNAAGHGETLLAALISALEIIVEGTEPPPDRAFLKPGWRL